MSRQKIKILQTIRQGQISGGESQVFDLVSNINTEEFETVVLSFSDGPMVEMLRNKRISTYVVDTLKTFNITTFNNVQAIMRSENIDILHAHGARALSNVLFPAKALGIPIIYTVHGWAFHEDQMLPVKKMREFSEKFLTSNSDLTISVSNSDYNNGIKHFSLKKSKVIGYGVNIQKFNPNHPVNDIREPLGLTPGKTVTGFINKFTAENDPFTMIKAIAYIKKLCTGKLCGELEFLMAGNGELKQAAIDMAREMDVSDMIRFHPHINNLPEVLNAIDIYCLPSRWDESPIEMLEAMAMRKAVITTPSSGFKDAVKNDFNGIIISKGDHEQLALSILRLHYNSQFRQELSERAMQTIRKNYDLKNMVADTENIYRGFMQNKMTA